MSKEDLTVVKDDEGTVEGAETTEEIVVERKGHLSYEEWIAAGHDPKQYKGEAVFDQIGDLMGRVDKMDRAIGRYKEKEKKMDEAIKKLAEHTSKQVQEAYDRALKDLKKQKAAALRDDDHEAVVEIDEKIAEVKEQGKQAKEEVVEQADDAVEFNQEVARAAKKWTKDPENSWYRNDPKTPEEKEMKEEADYAFQRGLAKGLSPEDALEEASKRVKKEFPQHFRKAKVTSKVGESGDENRGNLPPGSKGKISIKSIDPLYQKMAKEMSAMNPKDFPTPQSYVDALAADGFFN